MDAVFQHQPPVAGEVDVHHLDVRVESRPTSYCRAQRPAHAAIAALVMDGVDAQLGLLGVVDQVEQPPARGSGAG